MGTTYSKKAESWAGFHPVAYSLDNRAFDLRLEQFVRDGDERVKTEITIGDLLKSLQGRQFEIEDNITSLRISTDAGSRDFQGPSFNRDLARLLVELSKEEISPFEARWLFYDKDSCTDDVMDRYQFFLVAKDRIVREEEGFTDSPESGFDPTVFDSGDKIPPIWLSHPQLDSAWAAYWYRKFYTETKIGKLMVLRPDNPVLYHYPEGRRWLGLNVAGSQMGFLRDIRFLLWLVIALEAFIAFLLIRRS